MIVARQQVFPGVVERLRRRACGCDSTKRADPSARALIDGFESTGTNPQVRVVLHGRSVGPIEWPTVEKKGLSGVGTPVSVSGCPLARQNWMFMRKSQVRDAPIVGVAATSEYARSRLADAPSHRYAESPF